MHTMKKFIALALVTLGITVSARAQWIVYDPANTVQSVINTAQEIAKYIEMNGATVTRREAPYLPVAAVQKTTDNFLSVSTAESPAEKHSMTTNRFRARRQKAICRHPRVR